MQLNGLMWYDATDTALRGTYPFRVTPVTCCRTKGLQCLHPRPQGYVFMVAARLLGSSSWLRREFPRHLDSEMLGLRIIGACGLAVVAATSRKSTCTGPEGGDVCS